MIELGSKARDIITGFEGIVGGHCRHLTGCDQYSLTPMGLKDDGGMKEGAWFDEQRLEVLAPPTAKMRALSPAAGRTPADTSGVRPGAMMPGPIR